MSINELDLAWQWRLNLGSLQGNEAYRVFHGPGEGTGGLQSFAVDRYQDYYWVTQWEDAQLNSSSILRAREQIITFLKAKGAQSVISLGRPEKGVAPVSELWWGSAPQERFFVREQGIQFWIQLLETRHPGLFLDHFPLRKWLQKNMNGLRVLNTFAYTGSLSVAAAAGGASQVTTLDLSKPTIQWAKENLQLNGFVEDAHRCIFGDVFEWLPKMAREKKVFDCVILDPPSFSHGNKGRFSTSKDLTKLHSLALDLLSEEGYLITSINSANVSWKKYESDLMEAFSAKRLKFRVISQIDLPETFPTFFGDAEQRYLKGWILKRVKS